MKIGLLTIAAALLSAQYVTGVDVRTRSNVGTRNSTNSTGGTTNSTTTTHTHTHTHNTMNSAGTTNSVNSAGTTKCTYENFKKVVTIQTDDKSITKNDLKFNTPTTWLKTHVVEKGNGKFTLTMNCDCCHPQGKLCEFKCKEGAFIHISAKGHSGQKTQLWLNNDYIDGTGKRKRNPKHGDLLFSISGSGPNKALATKNAKVTSEYKKYGSRRRLLQSGKGAGC